MSEDLEMIMIALLLLATLVFVIRIFIKVRNMHLFIYKQYEEIVKNIKYESFNLYKQVEDVIAIYIDLNLTKSLPPTRDWSASPDFLRIISRLALSEKPRVVVEASSGTSTIVLAKCMQINRIGHIYSLEHDPDYAAKTEAQLRNHGLSDWATIIVAPLTEVILREKMCKWYSIDRENLPDSIDMIVVDGPPLPSGRIIRYPAGPILLSRMSKSGILIMDDANRDDERETIKIWLQEDPLLFAEFIPTEKGACVIKKCKNYSDDSNFTATT